MINKAYNFIGLFSARSLNHRLQIASLGKKDINNDVRIALGPLKQRLHPQLELHQCILVYYA